MTSSPSSTLQLQYLNVLKKIAATLHRPGKRVRTEVHIQKLVVSAVISGIPKSKVSKMLGIAFSTLHRWCFKFEKELKRDGLIKPSLESEDSVVQTLSVVEPAPMDLQGDVKSFNVEIQVGDITVRVMNGRAA